MRDLFKRGSELARETLKVVTGGARCIEERAIGQKRRTGKIVGEPHFGDLAGGFGLKPGEVEGRLDQVVLGLKGDLVQGLEPARRLVRQG